MLRKRKSLETTLEGSKQVTVHREKIDIIKTMQEAFDLHQSGQLHDAERLYQKIIEQDPNYADALYLLGLIFSDFDKKDEAIRLIQAAIKNNPAEAQYYKALGNIHYGQKSWKNAVQFYEQALQYDPNCLNTLNSIGSAYREIDMFSLAEKYLSRVLELAPQSWPALNTRCDVYLHCGKAEEAIADYKRAHNLNPDIDIIYSAYLFALNYSTEIAPEKIYSEHQVYDVLYGKGKVGDVACPVTNPDPHRKLRIGYLSPDFFNHAVSFFIEPILKNHRHDSFETYCYHVDNLSDAVTARLKGLSDHWDESAERSVEELAKKIRDDQIDILIDLAGHTSNNRLLVFPLKPAPIQITWLGYLNTTGLSSMDYRITDKYADPINVSEHLHSEDLIRLPHSQWCFNRPQQAIQVNELPALSEETVCFGSFNRYSKLSEKILKIWVRLLNEIDQSTLLMIDVPDGENQRIQDFFVNAGIASERIELYPRIPLDFFRKLHHKVDIALDSHPYSGGTTTCESLWMGVPTLTLTGGTSISRSTSSLMQTMGLGDWVTNTEDQFIEAAKHNISNLDKLNELRRGLRNRLENSPIMDSVQFTLYLEKAYREAWIKKCSELSKTSD